jgi:FKBP-type peptidyl-prolyl cis-trans isomerase
MFGFGAKVQTEELRVGDGREAARGDMVSVHYEGRLADGSVFDSSEGGDPFVLTIGAGEVIRGWEIGLVGMCVGGKRRLVIPPRLAYGNKGVSGAIPPKATLTFDVELVSVE